MSRSKSFYSTREIEAIVNEVRKRYYSNLRSRRFDSRDKTKRRVATDAEEPAGWTTLENGAHIPLNEEGTAIGGPPGVKGKDFSKAESSNNSKGSPKSRGNDEVTEEDRSRGRKIAGQSGTKEVRESTYSKATSAEPKITATVKNAVEAAGCNLAGLDYRLKTGESFERKFNDELSKTCHDFPDAPDELIAFKTADRMFDVVRYTSISEPETFTENYGKVMGNLEKQGYKVVRVKNSLHKEGEPYRGVNTVIEDENGNRFELQFHTKQSLEIKEEVHKLYEVYRNMENKETEEAVKLNSKMESMSRSVITPKDCKTIEVFDHTKDNE